MFIEIAKEKEREIKTTEIIIEEIDFERLLYGVLNDIDPNLGKSFTETLFTQGLKDITLPKNYLLRWIEEKDCLTYNMHLLNKKLLILSLLDKSSHKEQIKNFKKTLKTLSDQYNKEDFIRLGIENTHLRFLKPLLSSLLDELKETLWSMERFQDCFDIHMNATLEIFEYEVH